MSVVGAILVGVGQVVCFLLGSLTAIVPVIGLLCGLGSALSTLVDEMALHLHFMKERHQALTLYGVAFSLSAIVYPPVFLILVDTYGLNGALLVSGALSLNGLAGSVVITRPVWLPPDIPLPPLYRRTSDIIAEVEALSPTSSPEKGAKGGSAGDAKGAAAADKLDPKKPPVPAGDHEEPASGALAGVPSGVTSAATSGMSPSMTSGVTTASPTKAMSIGKVSKRSSPAHSVASFALHSDTVGQGPTDETPGKSSVALVALAERQGATLEDLLTKQGAALSPGSAAPSKRDLFESRPCALYGPHQETDNSVGIILVFYCALTSLSVTAGAVVYDYAMGGDRSRSLPATVALVSLGLGDLLGRIGYETLLATGEHRKVMAVQAFLQGGVLFLMALAEEIFMLVPVSFALGWLSSTLDMLPVPVMQRFVESDIVDKQLGLCRGASGVACLLGPVLVMIFRDGGSKSYAAMFVVSGCLSLLAGALWLPGLKKEVDEARAKAATAAVPPAAKAIDMDAVVAGEEAVDQEHDALQAGHAASPGAADEPHQ
ncbi:hypothetical protein HPB50_007028 [Hyalomma asiaticum]|uniref:Uncharacterized protein n=1 Tax=Hyalomma asiaticum TaxID=266040 RepID=A0ACB7T7F8_HYAAI|nr:hypothetical protein HPB50_007028 [Hyalomma asiaticum]